MIPLWRWMQMTAAEREATPLDIHIDLTAAEPADTSKLRSLDWDRRKTGETENGEWNA